MPEYPESERHSACNAETLTTHLAKIKQLIADYSIDELRFWSLGETGSTPGRDTKGNCRKQRFMRRNGSREARVPDLTRSGRVTIMPFISAIGERGPPLFVFKGRRISFRQVIVDGQVRTQTCAQVLPRHACIATREENGGVDSANFLT